jgi:hypothetical protein
MLQIHSSFGLFILAIFLSLTAGYAESTANTQKCQEADGFIWDFGKVKEGKVLKHKFALKNKTKKILNIKDIFTSCGCTISKVRHKKIPPAKSTFVEIEVNTKGYSGAIEQYAYVRTDSSDNQILQFTIKATVLP